MRNTAAAGSLAALALLGTTACGPAEDVISSSTSAAACAAAQRAVDPIVDGARSAVQELGVDPAAARRELQALKGVVDAAAAPLSGEIRTHLKEISGSLGLLVDEARTAARGAVDQQAVDRAQDELGAAVDDIGRIC